MRQPRQIVVVLSVAALVATACVPSTATSRPGGPAAPFDRQFIDMMVPHHQGAVEMARIAEHRAQHPEIRALAADILRTQSAEIEQMQRWRQEWFGSAETPPLSRMPMVEGMEMPVGAGHAGRGGTAPPQHTMDMAEEVKRLREAREPFDRAFIDAMIPHHQDAVAAARAALTRAERAEIKNLAEAIIAAQEREIAQLREWRRAWYGAESD